MRCRFRADPTKIRTSLRYNRSDQTWTATVQSRADDDGRTFEATERKPTTAMFRALDKAFDVTMEGVDVEMEGVYSHPHNTSDCTLLDELTAEAEKHGLRY